MSDDMIRRMAKAMVVSIAKENPVSGEAYAGDEMVPFYMPLARAAMAAAREPTVEMLAAGNECDGLAYDDVADCRTHWIAMVDAVLGDSITEQLPETQKTL